MRVINTVSLNVEKDTPPTSKLINLPHKKHTFYSPQLILALARFIQTLSSDLIIVAMIVPIPRGVYASQNIVDDEEKSSSSQSTRWTKSHLIS
jgi:hypothetical protein